MRQLVHKSTGKPVIIGDKVTDFRGDQAFITEVELPRHEGSTGRVYVRELGSEHSPRGYFPSVFGLEWRSTNEEVSANAN